MRPDFSPAMLRLFLKARIGLAADMAAPGNKTATIAAARTALRRAAKLSKRDFALALGGRLNRAAPRTAIWDALGVVPGAHGVRLTDGGGQEVVS